jgi:hypothetical protein
VVEVSNNNYVVQIRCTKLIFNGAAYITIDLRKARLRILKFMTVTDTNSAGDNICHAALYLIRISKVGILDEQKQFETDIVRHI